MLKTTNAQVYGNNSEESVVHLESNRAKINIGSSKVLNYELSDATAFCRTKSEPLFFFIMRLNLKAVLLWLTIAVVIITFVVYTRLSDFIFRHDLVKRWDLNLHEGNRADLLIKNSMSSSSSTALQDIDCVINQEYSIKCKHDDNTNEVYVPFSFLRDYYEVSGSINSITSSGNSISGNDEMVVSKFYWMHSSSKINIPKFKYDPRGLFMYFENYNVEMRDRVKCISAAEGVPISTQWEKKGYFYPTQIAQFGLSHYSKNLTEPEPHITILEDADSYKNVWHVSDKYGNMTRVWHSKLNTSIIQFDTSIGFDSIVNLSLNGDRMELVLSLDMLLSTNSSSLLIALQHQETKYIYKLHYMPDDLVISVEGHNIYYGLGRARTINKWRHITRDLLIDVQKGIAAATGGDKKSQAATAKFKRSELKVISVGFLGVGFFDNLTLSTYDHLANFYDAAEWLVRNQDLTTGGWPNPVKRSLNGFAELEAGWLSAMGQGHAISVLARAYWHSGRDRRFLRAASRGLKPYSVLSKEGGVLAKFMDKFSWYEEYPTSPASFVLNGFIYSLLGLYDLNSIAPNKIAREAGKLFQQGMLSLKKMLLLYDTGSGTIYDLRHLSLGVAPNLARWDYHATHVNQLLLLATIDSDPVFTQTAERWKNYMLGKRANHN